MLDSVNSLCYNVTHKLVTSGRKQGRLTMDQSANILGELNQEIDLESWETGDEEKEREQLEELFGPQ